MITCYNCWWKAAYRKVFSGHWLCYSCYQKHMQAARDKLNAEK